ncbi:unnamed protein product [Closterium sp. NIES-53]
MAGTHEMKEELVMRMRVIAVHLERTRIADMREMIGQVEERGGEMAAELAAVRRELAKQRDIAERREADLRELREEVRMREDEMRAELARKREERREVQEMNWPRHVLFYNILLLAVMHSFCTHFLQAIKAASQETHLNLSDLTCLSDAILTHVSTMTHLKSIDLNNSSGFDVEGFKYLYLSSACLTDGAMEGIGCMRSLKSLYIHRTKVTDAGLPHLTPLSSLIVVFLTNKGVTDAGMEHLGKLTGLQDLSVQGTEVTDDGLWQSAVLANLRAMWSPKGPRLVDDDVHRRTGG